MENDNDKEFDYIVREDGKWTWAVSHDGWKVLHNNELARQHVGFVSNAGLNDKFAWESFIGKCDEWIQAINEAKTEAMKIFKEEYGCDAT